VVVRALETTGRASRARLELGLLGRVLEEDFGPHQLRTFRVPADPSAPVEEVDLVEWALRVDTGTGTGQDRAESR
jgi:alpha-mannosidase